MAVNKYKRHLYGKTVVITGASSGIGRAAAIAFAENGANLVLAARREDALRAVVVECIALGVKAIAVKTDVTDAEAMKYLAETAEAFGGNIDVWINNAGIGSVGEFTQTPVTAHQRVIETNLLGYVHGAHVALPFFKKQLYGVLINTNSLGAWIAQPYSVAYAASKWGLRGFSEALRGELIKYPHIYICDIFPGFIDTPGFQHSGNFVGRKIKPIPPVYDARRVAKAMVALAVYPKNAMIVGKSTIAMKFLGTLFPAVTRKVLVSLMDIYFKRAKKVPISNGSLFESDNAETDIDGGWRSSHTIRNIAIAVTAVAAGIGIIYWVKKGRSAVTLHD